MDPYVKGPSPRKRWLVLTLSSLLFICSQFYRVSNAIIAPQLQMDLSLSAETLGLLSAVFFYAFALTQIPLGFSLDRLGARLSMAFLSVTGATGSIIFALARGTGGALLGRALLGMGMAGNLMGAMKLLTRWFSPREFATLSGSMVALGTFGNMLAATPLALLVDAFGWRVSFLITGGATYLFAGLFFLLITDYPEGSAGSPSGDKIMAPALHYIRLLITSREYWIISLGTFVRYGLFVAIQGLWIGPYLIQALGFSTVKAGNLILMMNVGYFLGAPLSGWLSDRVIRSPRRVVLLGLAISAFSVFFLSLGSDMESPWLLGGILLAFGIFSSFGFVMYTHIKELMPSDMSGTALTSINLFTMLGGAVFMQAMGLILEHIRPIGFPTTKDYNFIFLIGFLCILFALGLYFFTREKAPEDPGP